MDRGSKASFFEVCQPPLGGDERVIAAEKQLVPHTVLLNQHQAVVQLKGSVMQSADVGIHIGVLADDGDALVFVRMS